MGWWDNLSAHPTVRVKNLLSSGTSSQRTLLQGRQISGLVGQSLSAPYCMGDKFLGRWNNLSKYWLVGQSPNAPYCRGDKFLGWWDNLSMHPTAGETNFWTGGTIYQRTLLQGRRISRLMGQSLNAPYCRGVKFVGWWEDLQTPSTAGETKLICRLVGQSLNAHYCRGDEFLG